MNALGYVALMFIGWLSVIFCCGVVIAGGYRVMECWEEGRRWGAVRNGIATVVIAIITISLLMLLTTGRSLAQCTSSTDTLFTDGCSYIDAIPPILPGETFSHCWVLISESDNLQPGFLLVQSPGCGAIAYSDLTYEIWSEPCDSLYASGVLWPLPQVNPSPYLPDTSINYLLCLTWVAGCVQDAYCASYEFSPLPVTMLSFDGHVEGKSVVLEWITGSEQGTSHFAVRKSTDASSWRLVGIVGAGGYSATIREYLIVDRSPVPGVNYYQIEAVDLDGSVERFRTIAVNFDSEANPGFLYWYNGQLIRE